MAGSWYVVANLGDFGWRALSIQNIDPQAFSMLIVISLLRKHPAFQTLHHHAKCFFPAGDVHHFPKHPIFYICNGEWIVKIAVQYLGLLNPFSEGSRILQPNTIGGI